MQKLLTKKQRLEKYIAEVVICNTSKKSNHCLTQCNHGKFHEKEVGKDGCHHPQFCSLSLSGIRKVKCKCLFKKDQKEWVKKEINNES